MIRQSVRFFDEHYQAYERRAAAGRWTKTAAWSFTPLPPANRIARARNPADLIAGLAACLDSLLALDDGLVPPADKAYYRDYLKRLPVYTYATVDGDRVFQPAASWKRYQNVECPQFYPLFPFNQFALEVGSTEQGAGSPGLAPGSLLPAPSPMTVFRNTWKHGTFPKNMVQSWHQDGIFFARMGLTSAAADYNGANWQTVPAGFRRSGGPATIGRRTTTGAAAA